MVKLCVRMVDAKWVFLGCNIISKYQIKLIIFTAFSCNWGDRIVWFSICLGKNKYRFICIITPFRKDNISKRNNTIIIFVGKPNHRHWPLDNSRLNILKSFECEFFLYRCLCHSKLIISALKMVMT